MAKVNGSLLITAEGMEVGHIPPCRQDDAVGSFFNMKVAAERRNDRFYALPELYSKRFSYGDFYTEIYKSWKEFHANPALSHIKLNTFQQIHSFSQYPNLWGVEAEEDFGKTEEPRAHSGFCNPQGFVDFVGNVESWEEWHRVWLVEHQEEIDWKHATNGWLPRQDLILAILKREVSKKLEEDYDKEEANHRYEQIPETNMVHEFHDYVMGHQGDRLQGYASSIGGEICRKNYYRYEAELSDMERQYAKSMREIYSIVNKSGVLQFISIDFKHGYFEFHDERGEHQGEFRFDGSYNSGAESDHSLKTIAQWRKRVGM